ncbi:hypothetical protein Taro_021503, partial [Colocasia esculenta]|nr:hypothetical protein [Colocasia esculenta]
MLAFEMHDDVVSSFRTAFFPRTPAPAGSGIGEKRKGQEWRELHGCSPAVPSAAARTDYFQMPPLSPACLTAPVSLPRIVQLPGCSPAADLTEQCNSKSCRSGDNMGVPTSETDDFLKEFYIPTYILDPQADGERNTHMPKCPVLVFINSKSGGQLGGNLLLTYRQLLSGDQVFDLGKEAPDTVLHRVYRNLARLKRDKDPLAAEIEKALRLIVAGGDGTASWLLGVVSDLKLSHPPPVATVPLGTGNNLPFAFGWGKKNPGIDSRSVKNFLQEVQNAKEMKIDSWHIIMRMRIPKEGSCDPVPTLELPHSLHAFQRVSCSGPLNVVITYFMVDFGTTSAW